MDDDLEAVRAIFESPEPIVIRMRHEPHEEAQRLLVGLGAGYVVDPAAPRCVRQCGREECRVSAVATRRWCRMYGCGDEPVADSEFCSAHQHAAGESNGRDLLERMDRGEPVGLEEASEPIGAGSGVSSSPKPGPVEPAPTPEGESARAGGGARAKWTREKIVAAIREVGEKVGRTPSGADMRAHGLGGAYQVSSFARLGVTWAELVVEAGYEPRQRGDNGKSSGREPSAAKRDGVEAAADDATVTGDEENLALTLRDPIQTAEIPYDADVLEDEAEFLRSRAAALEQIAGGIRELARLSTRETAA